MATLWSDYTDFVIGSIDKKIGNKYKMSLRDLLATPSEYGNQQDIDVTLKNMSEDINSYIDDAIAAMPEEKTALTNMLVKADSITKQIASNVSMQAKQYKVPMVKPVSIERNQDNEESIFIDAVGPDVLALVDKLVSSSTMVADFSYTYENSSVGSWFFGGSKNYMLNVYLPDNDVIMLEASRAEINELLDAATVVVHGA